MSNVKGLVDLSYFGLLCHISDGTGNSWKLVKMQMRIPVAGLSLDNDS